MQVSFNPNVSFRQQTAQMPLNTVTENIYAPKQDINKNGKSKFINGISDIAKFFASISEITKGVAKGLFYGGTTALATLGSFWLLGTVPKAMRSSKEALKEVIAHPMKHISKTGKGIATILSLSIATVHVIKGILNKNQRNANIDHKLQTGHNA